MLANNKFVIDVDAYYSVYRNFLGQVEVAVPTTGPVGTDAAVLDMLSRGKQIRYCVYTKVRDTYHSYGTSLALTWNFYRKYVLTGNMSYNALVSNDNPDVFMTGFNTPKHVTNISFGNREVIRHVGYGVGRTDLCGRVR